MRDSRWQERISRLGDSARIRARFVFFEGVLEDFVVQLETIYQDKWVAVARYDTWHGQVHLDLIDREGNLVSKSWKPLDSNEGMKLAMADFRINWGVYLKSFGKEGQ